MLVENIIKTVLKFMEKHDVVASMEAGEIIEGENAQEISSFIDCLNLVRNEIATEYIPNVVVEKVRVENNRLDFSELANGVIEVLSVKDKFGFNIKFDKFSDHIQLENGTFEVKYNAIPEILKLNSEFNTNIPERVYAYGIMREYFYIQTLYEDASMWEERFKNSLQSLERKKNETFIPRRRWL